MTRRVVRVPCLPPSTADLSCRREGVRYQGAQRRARHQAGGCQRGLRGNAPESRPVLSNRVGQHDVMTYGNEVVHECLRRPPMKYMLLLRHEPGTGPAEGTAEFDAEMAQWGQVMGELGAAGAMVAANGLDTEATATTVRTARGRRSSPTAPSPRRRSRSSATSSSTWPTSTLPSTGPRRCPTSATGPSRCVRCRPTSRTPDW